MPLASHILDLTMSISMIIIFFKIYIHVKFYDIASQILICISFSSLQPLDLCFIGFIFLTTLELKHHFFCLEGDIKLWVKCLFEIQSSNNQCFKCITFPMEMKTMTTFVLNKIISSNFDQ